MAININGIVYNNGIVAVDGLDADINGYITSISYDSGVAASHVTALTVDGTAPDTNAVMITPSVTLTFSPGSYGNFQTLMNDRFSKFTLNITEFATGNLAGATHIITFIGCQNAGTSGGSTSNSPQNTDTIKFVCRNIIQ